MPKAYEAMRDKFAKGAAVDSPAYNRAQSKAAAIYNSTHPGRPVTGSEGAERVTRKAKARSRAKRWLKSKSCPPGSGHCNERRA